MWCNAPLLIVIRDGSQTFYEQENCAFEYETKERSETINEGDDSVIVGRCAMLDSERRRGRATDAEHNERRCCA